MKKIIVDNSPSFQFIDIEELVLPVVSDVIRCNSCNKMFDVITLSIESDMVIKRLQRDVDDFIKATTEAVRLKYGNNVYIEPLAKGLKELKDKYNKSRIKVLK